MHEEEVNIGLYASVLRVVRVQGFTYKTKLGQSVVKCVGDLAGLVAAQRISIVVYSSLPSWRSAATAPKQRPHSSLL